MKNKFVGSVSVQSECPPFMQDVIFEKLLLLPQKQLTIFWDRLQQRETFTRGQIFPYRVEFMAPHQSGPFLDGELNIHHGPLLSVHGAIDGLTANHRGLCYIFGSYVLTFRLIRPVRLDFFLEQNGVRVQLRAFVRPSMRSLWLLGNRFFWSLFGFVMRF